MMKQNKIKKNIMALLLAVAMIVTTCPQWVKTVQAAELPNNTQFATKEQLKSFNTNDSDGEKIQRRFILATTTNNGGLPEASKSKD